MNMILAYCHVLVELCFLIRTQIATNWEKQEEKNEEEETERARVDPNFYKEVKTKLLTTTTYHNDSDHVYSSLLQGTSALDCMMNPNCCIVKKLLLFIFLIPTDCCLPGNLAVTLLR